MKCSHILLTGFAVFFITQTAFAGSRCLEEPTKSDDLLKFKAVKTIGYEILDIHNIPIKDYDTVSYTVSYEQALNTISLSIEMQDCCEMTYDFGTQMECYKLVRTFGEIAASRMLLAAGHAEYQNKKEVAKKIYREIIISFTGNAYASYVKKAEFALQDLEKEDK